MPEKPGQASPPPEFQVTFADNFGSKVKAKLNQLRKKYPDPGWVP
jgi:hypothetical protein